MATLITGGTSKVGLGLAKRIKAAERELVFATRSPHKVPIGSKYVTLDWYNPATFENAFAADLGQHIESVYLLPPPGCLEPLPIMKPFIDIAVGNGVKMFVLMSGSPREKGGLGAGRIHEYLDKTGIKYVVLRPTCFIENLFGVLADGIKARGELVSVVPTGRIPFVSVEDIAQAAFDAIVNSSKFKDVFLLGPQAYSYDDIAGILEDYVGKPVAHKVISVEEQVARYKSIGMPADHAALLVEMEAATNDGREERHYERDSKYIGTHSVVDILEMRLEFWTQ